MRACRKRMYVYVYVRRYEQRRVEGENYCRIFTVAKIIKWEPARRQ